MATTVAAASASNPTFPGVLMLLNKINDPDPDFRFMSLNDLLAVLTSCRSEFLASNSTMAFRCIDEIIKTLDDTNGEVQNLAVRCLAPLSSKLPPQAYTPLLEKLSTLELKNSIDTAVPALSIRTCIQNLPRPEPGIATSPFAVAAYDAIVTVLVPRLLSPASDDKNATSISVVGSSNWNAKAVIPDSVNVLIEIVRCFGALLSDKIISWMQQAMSMLLDSEASSSAVKRRAVVAISVLAPNLSDQALAAMLEGIANKLSQATTTSSVARRNYITILGSTARTIPARFGRYLAKLVPFVLESLGEEELQALRAQVDEGTAQLEKFDEVREAALIALEAFLTSCSAEMVPHTHDTIQSALRYLKYDPNSAVDEDDEEEEDEEEEVGDDDFDDDEDDDDFDDDDDTSWKVRRCAAKVIASVVTTRSHDLLEDGVLYQEAAPALVKRFNERQENVRLEVIAAMAQLVKKSGDGRSLSFDDFDLETPSLLNRKRRRQDSGGGLDAGLMSPTGESIPTPSGPRADLARLTPAIIKQSQKLLKGKMVPTKQAIIRLLNDIVCTQRGGVGDALSGIMDLIVETIRTTGSGSVVASALTAASGNASATPTTLRMAGLKLVTDIAKTHSSSLLTASVPEIVDVVTNAAVDRFYKVSSEAIRTAQELVKTMTPPRCRANGQTFKPELAKLYETIIGRINSSDADLEVRQRAIHALATLVARTSTLDSSWLSAEKKAVALATVLDRLKNETTRLAAVRAVETIVASPGNLQFGPQWTHEVAQELAAQLRKANRTLKVSSIQALRRLLTTPTTKSLLDREGAKAIIPSLLPAISEADPQVLGPALLILASLALDHPDLVVDGNVLTALCELFMSNLAGIALEQILTLVTNVGSTGQSQALMTVLLRDVSISGDPNVVGKVIGALVVSSGPSSGVTAQSFVTELGTSTRQGDERRVALALAVLGEIGLRLGRESPIKPALFLEQFHDEPDKVSVAAATALGRAGSADVGQFLPVILNKMGEGGNMQYLSILAVKEILHKSSDLAEYSAPVWDHMLAASTNPESKVVCAECVGRLVIMKPSLFMPQLQGLLTNPSQMIRAMAVQAVRYSLAENDESFDRMLQSLLVKMLETMQEDSDMEIRRLAMTTLNSAVHNKPDILLPSLPQFMSFVFAHTVINRDLIREVKLGPFTHIVDDGLELRKSAYDTLYALMETAFARLPIKEFYDRVIAGLSDDNDIRALCNLMITKLITLSPDETMARLDEIAENYRKTLLTKLKEHSVKQDLEKQSEANKGVLRVTLLLADRLATLAPGSAGSAPHGAAGALREWDKYWQWVQKEFEPQIKVLREESRSLQSASM